jgi:hypothetical protein
MTTETPANDQNEALRSFLADEIKSTNERLEVLKPKLRDADYKLLNEQLAEKGEILQSPTIDRNELLILRREIGNLRESAETLSVKPGLWSRIPTGARVAIFALPVLIYLLLLTIFQWNNQAGVQDYTATQTAIVAQATIPSPAATSIATQIPTP